METTAFNVPSISCSNCAGKIQEGVKTLNGVGNVSVDLKSQVLQVEYSPEAIQPQDIRRKIASMGYEVME